MRERAHEAGYTLIELLIVLGLLGVLSVLMLSGLNMGLRAWEAGEGAGIAAREVAVAQSRIRDFVRSAYPMIVAEQDNPHVSFAGEETRLNLIGLDRAGGVAGRSRITLAMRGGDFTVATVPELASTAAREEVLARGVARVSFAYLSDDGATWTNAWRSKAKLPRLVRVEVAFAAGDRRAWPLLVIAPRIDADVACSFDPLTKSCRGR